MSNNKTYQLLHRSECVTLFSPANINLCFHCCTIIIDITNGACLQNAEREDHVIR